MNSARSSIDHDQRGTFAWYDWWKDQHATKRKPVLATHPRRVGDGSFYIGLAAGLLIEAGVLLAVTLAAGWIR